jgi:hypothetical protein
MMMEQKMTALERIKVTAQRDANRTGEKLAILNLNCFNPMYVIRGWNDRFANDRQLVAIVEPTNV